MSKLFSTNVFIHGRMAFYEVSSSKPNIYHLNLRICRLRQNPPPQFMRIHRVGRKWQSLDAIQTEFSFIIEEIGQRIQDSLGFSWPRS